MRIVKKVLVFLTVTIMLIMISLVAIPYFFKEEIVEGIKMAANDEMDATLEFEDVSLSLIRHFPNLMVDISKASITGKGQFDGLTLYKADHTIIDLDLKSVWDKSRVGTAREITLINPYIHINTTADGLSNYDIAKASDPTLSSGTETESSFDLDLSKMNIQNGTFIYTDKSTKVSTQLQGIDISGHANLRGNTYNIGYEGTINETDIKASGIKYLNGTTTGINGALTLDLDQSKYEFQQNELVINELDLDVEGWLQNQSSAVLMDITFRSKDDSFKKLWSLVPAAYTSDFPNADIVGIMGVHGYVRGTYDDAKSQLPSFDLKITTKNGGISYPGMPKEIKDVFADININSPGPLDQMAINIPDFKFNMDEHPFEGRFLVNNALSNPNIDMAMNGTIDLKDIQDIMPLEGINTLNGIVKTDLQVKGKMSDLNNGAYQNTLISGTASLTDFILDQDGQPKMQLTQAAASFSPQSVKIENIQGRLGETRFDTDVEINNVIALLTPGQEVSGTMNWKSDVLDLNQWMTTSSDPGAESITAEAGENQNIDSYLPENFKLAVSAQSDLVKYGDYEAKTVRIKGKMANGDLDIENMSTTLDRSDIAISGQLVNVLGFLFRDEDLTGDMKLVSNYLDLNQFMTADSDLAVNTANENELDPIIIPESIKVDVDANIKRLTYDNIEIKDIDGIINVANGEARMNDVDAKAFDGEFKLNGGYIGRDGETPKFDLAYTINKFNFNKTFEKVNTFRFLAPIGKYINGEFNSTLKMSGDLTKELYPDFSTIDASGFFETFNGLIAGFKPLELINQYIKSDKIKSMKLTDTRNYFTVEDGTVTIKEFDQKIDDILMKISGSHTLNQEINYLIKTKLPKDKLAKTGITDLVDKGLTNINTQLNKLGFNINKGEYINLNFIITGTITSPKLDVRVVGMDGESDITDVVKEEINAAVETVKDSVKTRVNQEIDTLNSKVEKKRDELVDTASAIVKEKVDSAKANVKKEVDKVIADKIGSAIPDSLKTQIDSILLKGGGKEVEAVKDILKDFNPFKKKKKKPTEGGGG